jgi:hypothetical protein
MKIHCQKKKGIGLVNFFLRITVSHLSPTLDKKLKLNNIQHINLKILGEDAY